MSNFPGGFDDDSTLPAVNDNITEIGGDAINALRDAVFQIEQTLGLNVQGVTPNLAARLGVFINPDGSPNASVITSLGLVTLPITNNQIAQNAGIPESKLTLDYRTQDLFNYIRDLSLDVNTALGWISVSGVKLEPHLIGAIYRHTMDQVDVSANAANFLQNVQRQLRNNLNDYTLTADINSELLAHQWADGSPFGALYNITTNNGSLYSSYFAHVASGIFLNSSRFSTIPQINDNLQLFAEYIDTESIFLLGTRIQNLYSSGISTVSTSSNLTVDGYGQFIVPPTPAIAFLKNIGNTSSPFDDINSGDDIVQFIPSAANQASNYFDSQFALVRPGDIIRVLYGDGYNIEVPYVVREKKYNASGVGNKTYVIRIAGKNQFYSPHAVARIDRPLSNRNKYGELSISPVNNLFSGEPSLIINNPRGAQALGIGFDPDEFDEKHYNLYLAFYPTGAATDGYVFLPAIDVTGNLGKTPGQYTLESIVLATNNAFRAPGYNYRFTAFSDQGNFGICLADSYNNAGFSIVSAIVSPSGVIDPASTALHFPNNVVDVTTPAVGTVSPDPLGFGPIGANLASPPFQFTYGSSAAALLPTQLFIPLKRNNYYVNGSESERLAIEPASQALDGYGDGYWVATVQNVAYPPGRVQTTYRIPLDLSSTGLKIGKTIVVQPLVGGSFIDFGRFIIQSVTFNCAPNVYTDVTVYDAVHGNGSTPSNNTIQPFSQVKVYFSADSVSFNAENASDFATPTPSGQFKRYFEVYVDDVGFTYVQERGRITLSGGTATVNGTSLFGYAQLSKLDIVTISPKLRGYQYSTVNKITLNMTSFVSATSTYTGYLAAYDGTNFTHLGPITTGKVGEITRFYDETYSDYIEISFAVGSTISDFTNQVIDFQLFPTLELDTDIMLIGTCQVNDTTQTVNKIVDKRQFGNISEKDLSTSVFDYLAVPEKYFHSNGVVRGFDISYGNTTIASGSNGFALPQTVINVLTTQGFPSSGTLTVQTSSGLQTVQYTGITVNSFTGCTGGAGTMTIGGTVAGSSVFSGSSRGVVNVAGGIALVNGKIFQTNNETVVIPIVKELYGGLTYPINWFLCVNDTGDYVLVPSLDLDSNLNTPSAPTRTFTAFDFISSTTYTIPAVTFSDMIDRRPDLTVLYIVQSTITGTTTSPVVTLNVIDARRYAYKRDWGIVPTVNADAGNNGDFRNFYSLGSWLIKNAAYNSTVRVKGTFTNFPTVLSFPIFGSGTNLGSGTSLNVVFEGDGNAVFDSTNFGEFQAADITFNNMTIQNNGTLGMGFSGCNMNNCTVNCAGGFEFLIGSSSSNNTITNTVFTFTQASGIVIFANVTLTNCVININGAPTTLYLNSAILNNCTLNINGTGSAINLNGTGNALATLQGTVVNLNASGIGFTANLGELANGIVNWNSGANQPLQMNGNFFSVRDCQLNLNAGSSPSTMIYVLGGSHGIISSNSFVRGSVNLPISSITGLGGYVQGSINSICAVVNNSFDSTTCDGSNQTLVSVQQPTWVVQDNLNTSLVTNEVRVTNVSSYTVLTTDVLLVLDTTLQATTINLPSTTNSPAGRTITIKDLTGALSTNAVTFHRFSTNDYIEGLQADYVYTAPWGSITLILTANAVGTNSGWMIL